MKILAIESSGQVASAAISEGDALVGEYSLNYGAGVFGPRDGSRGETASPRKRRTHSETLMPIIDGLMKKTDTEPSELDAIAVSAGPGSFTGLRIGAATAKGLALALELPIIAVPTLDGLAANLWGCGDVICPLMDARRNQVYTGLYTFSGDDAGEGGLVTIKEQCALAADDIINEINRLGERVVFLGDGAPVYRDRTESLCTVPHSYAPPHMSLQKAGALAYLAQQYALEGRTVDADEFSPIYLRASGAKKNLKF